MKTPVSSIMLVFLASLIGSFGAVFLKLGAERLRYGFRHVISAQSFAGVTLFLLSSVFWVLSIKRGELSVLNPMLSLGYVWTMIWSRLWFREPFTKGKFTALGLILGGIALISAGA